jgi:cysteine-rich repeat protein
LRRFTATRSACGDGFVDAAIGEVCDDGNRRGCDGCAGDCRATLEECVAAYDCTGYQRPALPEPGACPDPSAPDVLGGCGAGSGNVGRWVVDADGLPAYDFLVDQRCDAAAAPYTPRAMPLRDPIHAVGNGRGLMAMAHASGAVELYTQDLGHKWVNRVDTWRDPENPSFPPQLGGGFNYYAVLRPGEEPVIGSTRFEDLPVGAATTMQSRRFGVGYFETVSGRDRTRSTGRTPHAPAKRTHTSPRR